MLTVREHMILDFEGRDYKYIGVKEQDIRELFGVTAPRYYQELNQLIDREEAYASRPLLVQRIRGRRRHRGVRIANTIGFYAHTTRPIGQRRTA